MDIKGAEQYLTYAVSIADSRAPLDISEEFNKALTVAKIDMDKQTPKPVIITGVDEGVCPICGYNIVLLNQRYCTYCGQALDWTEQEG